jgi:hypothetical protein
MRFLQSRLAIAAIAAATTVAASGLAPSGSAVAKRVEHSDTSLRAENKKLREELRNYRAAVDELDDGLAKVEKAARRLKDRRARQQLINIADDAQERAAEFLDDDRYDYDDDVDYRDHRDKYGTYAMSDADFRTFLKKVDDASFADDQLSLIKSAAGTNAFTVDQVVQLVKTCTFEDTKIEVAVMLHARLVDPDRAYLIESAFDFSSSKKTYRERIAK